MVNHALQLSYTICSRESKNGQKRRNGSRLRLHIQCANKEKSDSGRDFEIGRLFEKKNGVTDEVLGLHELSDLRSVYFSKGEGSTSNNLGFCNLHTPWSVSKWVEFDSLIRVEALKDENSIVLNANVEEKVSHIKRQK
jgi:hypothetical protein